MTLLNTSNLPEIPERYTQGYKTLLKNLEFGNERPLLKLNKIYAFMKDFSEFVATFATCNKGCSFCCNYHVAITDIEAQYIEENTGFKRNRERTTATREVHSPCTFLNKNGVCSIYEYRPFHCRTYHSLDDPLFCKTGEEHRVFGSNNGKYTVSFYAHFSEIIHHYDKGRPILDIRDFFPAEKKPKSDKL